MDDNVQATLSETGDGQVPDFDRQRKVWLLHDGIKVRFIGKGHAAGSLRRRGVQPVFADLRRIRDLVNADRRCP